MTTINLRPWREERAQQRQQQFAANAGGAVIFALVVVLGIGYFFDAMASRQTARNNYLESEIAILEKQIIVIKELQKQRESLLERLTAIQDLQGNRPLIVRNFDELVRVLPDGAYYEVLERQEDRVSIRGFANDNLDVSTLMRNIDQSIWFGEPQLRIVDSSKTVKKAFNLSVSVVKPDATIIEGQ